jgi:putative two-component system response regulator
MKVMVVDDDPICLELLSNAVTQMGHEVVQAANGMEALEFLQTHPSCRLVISDWEMPEMDGLELCHAIRFGDFSGYIYFVLLTSHDSPREKVLGLEAGADEFLGKPFDPNELSVRIKTAERILSLETRDVAIFAMAKLAESRDPETGAHLERMQNYCRVIAWHLAGLPEFRETIDREFLRLIYATSPLHDIGKVGIPDAVLLKPGKLTDQEFEIMKTHTTLGAQTLAAALDQFPGTRFLEMARDIAACHHEKYDGKGYPHGLAGDKIPLCARIVALADAYDALTTKRVYKPAFSHAKTRQIILEGSGTHFDTIMVEAFKACESQFLVIADSFREIQDTADQTANAGFELAAAVS